jgi:hypothetical protein
MLTMIRVKPCAEREPILPVELQDLVIDLLYNSLKDLKNCALVCWRWLFRSRYHVRILIEEGRYSNLSIFQRLLDPSLSSLSLSARHLRIHCLKATQAHDTLALLNRLQSLSTLSLYTRHSWRDAAAQFPHFSTITELVMMGRKEGCWSCILHLASSCPSLHKLEITGFELEFANNPTCGHPIASLRNLNTLIIQQCVLIDNGERSPFFDTTLQIRTLRLTYVLDIGFTTIKRALNALGPRLRELEFDFIFSGS